MTQRNCGCNKIAIFSLIKVNFDRVLKSRREQEEAKGGLRGVSGA